MCLGIVVVVMTMVMMMVMTMVMVMVMVTIVVVVVVVVLAFPFACEDLCFGSSRISVDSQACRENGSWITGTVVQVLEL